MAGTSGHGVPDSLHPTARLLRGQVTQFLPVGADRSLDILAQRVVGHDKVIGGGYTPIALGTQALVAGGLAVVLFQPGGFCGFGLGGDAGFFPLPRGRQRGATSSS